jgi:hypothetical protein
MGQTLTQEHLGRVTSDGQYQTVFTVSGRRNKNMVLRASNFTSGTVVIRVQESDNGVTWTSIYGQTLSPIARGVDLFGPITWSKNNLRVQASGAVDGTICINEICSKEAFCSEDDVTAVGTPVSSWYGISRNNWCSTYCQSGSEAMTCSTSCEINCQNFYQS